MIVVLLAVIAAESFVLLLQRAADRAARAQSARLLTQFLHGDTAETTAGRGVNIRLQNVRFKWSDRVYIDTGNMSVRAEPDQGGVVDFDNLDAFHLERLIAIPPNKSLMVDGNRLMVKPLGLFPPPRINGKMSTVDVDEKVVRLGFSGTPIPAPVSTAPNYVYLKGGVSQFGHFRMYDTDVLIMDRDTTNTFGFSLLHYAELIPKSVVEVHDTRSARITMPDY